MKITMNRTELSQILSILKPTMSKKATLSPFQYRDTRNVLALDITNNDKIIIHSKNDGLNEMSFITKCEIPATIERTSEIKYTFIDIDIIESIVDILRSENIEFEFSDKNVIIRPTGSDQIFKINNKLAVQDLESAFKEFCNQQTNIEFPFSFSMKISDFKNVLPKLVLYMNTDDNVDINTEFKTVYIVVDKSAAFSMVTPRRIGVCNVDIDLLQTNNVPKDEIIAIHKDLIKAIYTKIKDIKNDDSIITFKIETNKNNNVQTVLVELDDISYMHRTIDIDRISSMITKADKILNDIPVNCKIKLSKKSITSIKLAKIFSSRKSAKILISENRATISSKDEESTKEDTLYSADINIENLGIELKKDSSDCPYVKFNVDYLLNYVKYTPAEQFTLNFNYEYDKLRPSKIIFIVDDPIKGSENITSLFLFAGQE